MNSHYGEQCPVGTLMQSGRYNYRKMADQMWERVENPSYRYGLADFTWSSCQVTEFPNGMTELVTPQETVQQYKWRFREHALAAAVTHGVSYTASEQALADMGAGPGDFPLGAGITIKNPESYNRLLPAGSVVYVGDPENVDGFAVWARGNDRQWRRVLGPTNMRAPGDGRGKHVVYSLAGDRTVPEWVKAEGSETDETLIAEFQAVAWRRGWQLKQTQSWCSTYENVMGAFGLTRDAVRRVNGIAHGARVSSEAAAALPEGTLLGWQSSNNPGERVLFVRTNAANNVARTVRVNGTDGSSMRNYHSSMILVSSPEPQTRNGWASVCELPCANEWRSLIPVGSVFTNTVGGNYDYIIAANEGARQRTDEPGYRRWSLNDFGAENVLYFQTLEGVTL